MKAPILASALVLAAAVACGPPPSGVVVGREYDAPEISSKRSCSTSGTGKNKTTKCSTKPTYESAEWELTIRTPDGDTEIEVSETEFEACAQGETYPACGGGN